MGNTASTQASSFDKANSNDIKTLQSKINALSSGVTDAQTKDVNYDTLSGVILNTPDKLTKLTLSITNNPDKLSTILVNGISSNQAIMNSINQTIAKNQEFAKSVAYILTSDPTQKALLKGDTGAPGSLGDYASLKSNLFGSTLTGAKFPATIWCGDDNGVCNTPRGSPGIQTPNINATSSLLSPNIVGTNIKGDNITGNLTGNVNGNVNGNVMGDSVIINKLRIPATGPNAAGAYWELSVVNGAPIWTPYNAQGVAIGAPKFGYSTAG